MGRPQEFVDPVQINFQCPKNLQQNLARFQEITGLSQSKIVREALQAYFNQVDAERGRIRRRILETVTGLKKCKKDDDCRNFGRLIELSIDGWMTD